MMTEKQALILSIIQGKGPMTLNSIRKMTGMHQQTISVIMCALEKKGFISIPKAFGRRFFNKVKILKHDNATKEK